MIKNALQMLIKTLFAVLLMAGAIEFSAYPCAAQRLSIPPTAVQDSPDQKADTSFEDEMRAKREIRSAEKAHQENLNRARDLASISATLYTTFKTKSSFDRNDFKQLEKAEKLAKKIREAAGGSEDRIELEELPSDIDAALCRFADSAGSLKDKVEKTPKYVISTSVIDEANVLLELIRLVRTMHPKV